MSFDGRELAAIFAGGVLGALARAGLGEALTHDPGAWPWSTFLVNVAGAFVLGAVAARLAPRDLRRRFLGTGFCSALTTFSALQLELLQMLDAGRVGLAALYGAASLAAGLAGVVAGGRLARRDAEALAA